MQYQVLDTQLMQSAIKAGAQVTAALIEAGDESAKSDPVGVMTDHVEHWFGELKTLADADNKQLREDEAKAPKSGGKSWGGGGSKKGSFKTPTDGSMKLSWGAFKGLSIAEVYEMSADEAADYANAQGKSYAKSGATYIEWLSKNDKNEYAANHAKAFLDSKRS